MLSTIVRRQRCNLNNIWIYQKYSTTAVNVKSDAVPLENTYNNVLQQEWLQAKPFKSVPGPTKFQMLRGFMKGGDFHKKAFGAVMEMCRERYGDIYLMPGMFGQNTNLITFNLDDYEKIFRTEGPYPVRPGNELFFEYRLKRKDGVYDEDNLGVAGNGEQGGKFRHAVNPVLMQPRNTVLYIDPTQKVNDDFIKRIRQIRDPSTLEVPGDFLSDIKRLSFESVAIIALDKAFGLVGNDSTVPEAQVLFDNLHVVTKALYELGIQPSIYKYIKTPSYKRFEKSMDLITNICLKFVDEALQRLEERRDKEEAKSVLEKLVKIDRKIAVIMAADMLFAGVDTTSSVMSAVLLCMATHPEKQETLRQEILTAVGKTENFTMDNMKNLPYLRACIKESMRVHPLVFGNLRTTGADLCLSGYQIPKGTNTLLASNLLLKEERYFPRAKEFLPERWLRSSGLESDAASLKNTNPFIFLPFGFGPRSCVGKRIVDLQLEITLANIVRNFKMEFNYPTENAFENYFMNTCVIPLKLKFTDLK